MDNKALEKYIGWRFNKMTINTIEHEFDTYRRTNKRYQI